MERLARVTVRRADYELKTPFTLDSPPPGSPACLWITKRRKAGTYLKRRTVVRKWSLFDARKNIWAARIPANLRTRQLYVNDVRATRARGQMNPEGFVKTPAGFRSTGNLDFLSGAMEWKLSRSLERIPRLIDSISTGQIRIKQPCWDESQAHSGFTMDRVSWFENAYALLDEEGEWYLDTARELIFYKPRAGEIMSSARVVAPVLESLLIAKGTADRPLANLRISGLTFAHATWMQPSTAKGYPDLQSSYQYGDDGYGGDKIPSSVAFWFTDSLVLENNVFTAMGGNGPALEAGCRHGRISGNRIYDVSGNGLHIGKSRRTPATR